MVNKMGSRHFEFVGAAYERVGYAAGGQDYQPVSVCGNAAPFIEPTSKDGRTVSISTRVYFFRSESANNMERVVLPVGLAPGYK